MGKKSKKTQQEEEVDLGQLFKLIGNGFRNFFNFIGSILNKLFLAFVWLVFFIKKHLLKIVIAAIIGVGYGIINQRIGEPVYKSEIIIKQNYNTGEHLYNTLDYYNSLILDRDSITLGAILNIESNEVNSIIEFEIKSSLNENQKLELFDNYTKNLDSTLASTVIFIDFLKNSNDYEHQFQKITQRATTKNNFDRTFTQIIKNITSNVFFENEQKKDLEELTRKESIIRESLLESDTLKSVYYEVLVKSAEKVVGGATSITFEGSDVTSVTKEFELYNSDLELRRELVTIAREKDDLKYIIEIVSRQKLNGTLDKTKNIYGFEISMVILNGVLLALLTFIILLFIEFVNFLGRFKSKI